MHLLRRAPVWTALAFALFPGCTCVGGFDEDRTGLTDASTSSSAGPSGPGATSSGTSTATSEPTSGSSSSAGDGGGAPSTSSQSSGDGGSGASGDGGSGPSAGGSGPGGGGGDGGGEPGPTWPDSETPFCIDDLGETACPAGGDFAGQDGDYLTTPPQFVDVPERNSILDTTTQLEWSLDEVAVSTWTVANASCPAEFRLPSVRELVSVMDAGRVGDTRDLDFFAGFGSKSWTSQEGSALTHLYFDFAESTVGLIYFGNAEATRNATCVRGAPLRAELEDAGEDDEDVLDRSTGLQWRKAPLGVASTWVEALAACEDVGLRLPSIKELLTLLNPDLPGYIDGASFPDNGAVPYWTSTPTRYQASGIRVYTVHFDSPYASYADPTTPGAEHHVRCLH